MPPQTSESSLVLAAALLRRVSGAAAMLTFAIADGPFTVGLVFDRTAHFLELDHPARVSLCTTAQHLGGRRWWFLCPATGARVSKLWLPLCGNVFASRQAYRLGYTCQRTDRVARLDRRGAKIYRSLSGPTFWRDGLPPKPRWMR
jgi:hypothetical protein